MEDIPVSGLEKSRCCCLTPIGCGGLVLPQHLSPSPPSSFHSASSRPTYPFPIIQYCTSWNQCEILNHISLAIGRGWVGHRTRGVAVPTCRVPSRESQPPCQHLDSTPLSSSPASQDVSHTFVSFHYGAARRLTSVIVHLIYLIGHYPCVRALTAAYHLLGARPRAACTGARVSSRLVSREHHPLPKK